MSLSDKDNVVEIEFNFDPTKENVGTALHDSVSRQTYNYIYDKGYNNCRQKFKEFIKELKEELVMFSDQPKMRWIDDYNKWKIDKLAGKELSE